jgi:hypothetical protein
MCRKKKSDFKVLLGKKPTAWAKLASSFLIHNSCANLFMALASKK